MLNNVTGSAGAGGSANERFIDLGGMVETTPAGRLSASLGNRYEVIFDTFDYADPTPDGTLTVSFFDSAGASSTDFVLDLPDNAFTSFEAGHSRSSCRRSTRRGVRPRPSSAPATCASSAPASSRNVMLVDDC